MSLAHTPAVAGVAVDQEAILKTLNLNPRDPKVQALVLVCQQYGLDPVLKHAVLISGNLYVTRDGLLHVAHQSGRLDGIVVEDEGENADEWWAKVAVFVKGQSHPYTYRGRYPKSGHQKKYGPEMAVKCAEVMALRRAFGVTGIATVEEQWDKSDALAAEAREAPNKIVAGPEPVPSAGEPPASDDHPVGISESEEPDGVNTVITSEGGSPAPPESLNAALSAAVDDEVVDAVIVDEALDELRAAIALVPGLGEARVLKRARRIATDAGREPPESFEGIAGDTLSDVYAEVLAKVGS